MQLADVLDYTRVAAADLPHGGRVTVIERDPYLSLILRRGGAGEEDWHVAYTREDVPLVLALCGVLDPGDRWQYAAPAHTRSTAYNADCAAIVEAVEAFRVPPMFVALIFDTTPAGIAKVRDCAAIVRAGAVAACMDVA